MPSYVRRNDQLMNDNATVKKLGEAGQPFSTNTNKNFFISNNGNIVKVKVPVYLKDISDYFRQLTFPLEFCDYNISIQVVDEIYYKAANMNIKSQTIKSAYLYTDVCYLDGKNNLDFFIKQNFIKNLQCDHIYKIKRITKAL